MNKQHYKDENEVLNAWGDYYRESFCFYEIEKSPKGVTLCNKRIFESLQELTEFVYSATTYYVCIAELNSETELTLKSDLFTICIRNFDSVPEVLFFHSKNKTKMEFNNDFLKEAVKQLQESLKF